MSTSRTGQRICAAALRRAWVRRNSVVSGPVETGAGQNARKRANSSSGRPERARTSRCARHDSSSRFRPSHPLSWLPAGVKTVRHPLNLLNRWGRPACTARAPTTAFRAPSSHPFPPSAFFSKSPPVPTLARRSATSAASDPPSLQPASHLPASYMHLSCCTCRTYRHARRSRTCARAAGSRFTRRQRMR